MKSLIAATTVVLAVGVVFEITTGVRPASTQTCSSFQTCEEAMRSLRSGNTRLDRDGDGVPCESLCRGSSRSSSPYRSYPTTAPGQIYIRPARPPQNPRKSQSLASVPVTLVSVGDGDTIRVRKPDGDLVTVRLACIDAPETAQGVIGTQSTATLSALLSGGNLKLKAQTIDRYGRTVAEVIASGQNVNVALVKRGAAFVYWKYLNKCNRQTYAAAEDDAKRNSRGVWKWGGSVVKPWDFRKQKRRR